ncbi:hypothetical protein EJ07DRAFT_98285 [Lizonia empirigonia]|nr:hypothetical protein EJ07DRAFT_98285 [Lizonia empirigonia]
MPPPPAITLSPAELAFVRAALTQTPPQRLDATKGPRDFRSMRAECDVLPSAHGSARVALDDGTEALVGVKAEVAPTSTQPCAHDDDDDGWLEMSVDVPGFRADDALPVFLASMLTESLVAGGFLTDRLRINRRFHWKLYIDILLLSPPLSYPLGLLSMATHLALLSTRLPALTSSYDEDPLFNDDWATATPLYPRDTSSPTPPVIILAIAIGNTTIFDPCKEELLVADAVLALSCTTSPTTGPRIVALRAIDPPSHLTAPGVANALNPATGSSAQAPSNMLQEMLCEKGVWSPPRGGVKRGLVSAVSRVVVERGGMADELIAALGGIAVE